MITLSNIEKVYHTLPVRTRVLRQISMTVEEGEFVTIMGPSGAGKSTLLGIIGMLDTAYDGEYRFMGEPVHALKPKERAALSKRNVGYVFQQFHLLESLTVAENLEIPLSYRDLKRAERQALVAETLDRFNLVGRKDLYPSQLSGGQQQLIAVARAMIARPRVLLADEPTGNLHSAQAAEIMGLFRELNREGVTIVQVTHSEANAEASDRIVNLRDGWMVGAGRVATAIW